jgi:hypothetical protein
VAFSDRRIQQERFLLLITVRALQEPEKLSDDQVMELLTVAFHQPEVPGLLQNMLEETKATPLPEG